MRNKNLRLSSSPSVTSICGRIYGRNLSGRRLRLIFADHHNFFFGISRKSWELINLNATLTSKLDLQCIQVLKEAICHFSEGQQTNVNGRRSIFTECNGGVWQLQTADRRLQTGLIGKILLTVTSSSTTFPAQNNINLVAKIMFDFLW